MCALAQSAKSDKESTMLNRTNRLRLLVAIPVLVVTATMLGNAFAQKASVPKVQNKLAIAEEQVKQLLPLMDTDKNGMVSKQEFMNFMQAEFDRLDKSKKGELNVKELTQSTLTASRSAGK
jgi:sulfatase maturation enzyme AslB (radical SAM superfamily)